MPCSMQAAEASGDLNRKDRSVKPRSGLWSGILVLQLLRFVASDLRMEGLRQRREALQAARISCKVLDVVPKYSKSFLGKLAPKTNMSRWRVRL